MDTMNIQDETPETRDMWHRFYEGGGQEDEIFGLCRKLERERDEARKAYEEETLSTLEMAKRIVDLEAQILGQNA